MKKNSRRMGRKTYPLYLKRCRSVSSVWLDDQKVGSQDGLIAPHMYHLGTGLKLGKHRLTLRVDNTVKIDLRGFVSALFGGTWGKKSVYSSGRGGSGFVTSISYMTAPGDSGITVRKRRTSVHKHLYDAINENTDASQPV